MKKYIKIWFLVLGVFVSLSGGLYAQQRTLIRGTVMDSNKFPLPQATIIEQDKDNRTISSAVSDLDGNFSINMSDVNNILIFKYIGFKDRTVRVGDKRVLEVVMDDDTHELDDVVITAQPKQSLGGLLIDQRDLSVSVGRVKAEEISEVHAASIDDALQGRIAGVDIVGSTGNPGAGMSIRIRGLSSINGDNQPLIVVDGIPQENSVGAGESNFDYSTATEEEFSQMLNIPTTDIEEITVLKDAAAAAIYGAKAADGVIVITTKRGTISPPRISFRSTFTVSKQPKAIETLSGYEYSTLMMEALRNAGNKISMVNYPEFAYDPKNPEYYYNYSNNTDWVDALVQTGFVQDYTVSLSGGSRKVRYRFSTGFWDEKGITIETGFQRINARLNLDYYVSDKLRFSADIAYTHSQKKANFIPEGRSWDSGDLRNRAYVKMPNQGIYYYNPQGEQTSQYFAPYRNLQGTYLNTTNSASVYNPIAMARDGKNNTTSDDALPRFTLVYDPNDQWQYSFDVSFGITDNKNVKFAPQSSTGLLWSDTNVNFAQDKDDDNFVIQTFTKARYIPRFNDMEKHMLIALLQLNTYDKKSNTFYTQTTNLPSSQLTDPSVGARVYPNAIYSYFTQERSLSATLNVHYKLMDRYIVYGSIRTEGNSKFGDNYKYGWFPAISGRYRISKENFLKDVKWLDDFSIKASWGVNGRAPKYNYLQHARYETYPYTYLGSSATYPSSLALNNLRWERTTQLDMGVNLILFDDKVNIEVDYYRKRTKDGIDDSAKLPTTSGFGATTMNTNTVENIGWDVNVQTMPYRTRTMQVGFNFNFARSQNYIRKFGEYSTDESGSWDKNGSYLIRLEKDQPYGAFYGYKYDGVYLNKEETIAKDKNGDPIYTMGSNGELTPVYMRFGYPTIDYEFQAGDARYVDINNDGNIDLSDVVYLGDYNPLFTGGFGPTFRYKNLTVTAWFYFRYGNDIINEAKMNMESMYTFDNQSKAVLKRFRESYPVGTEHTAPSDLLPRALYGVGYNYLGSDRFVEDGSFLRWKTLTVKYNLPRAVANSLRLSELSFWVTLQNLYTWTSYTGQDPEVSLSTSNLSDVGRDKALAPRARQFTFGLQFGF